MRLRAAAITLLAQDPKADSAMIFRLARRFLFISQYERSNKDAEHEALCDIENKGCSSELVSRHVNQCILILLLLLVMKVMCITSSFMKLGW